MNEYKYLWVPFLSWFSVQLIKFITDIIKNKKINLKVLVASGGMPSSHTALVVSMAIATAKQCGTSLGPFYG